MHELSGRLVEPETALGPPVRDLTERLAASTGWGERFALIDSYLLDRMAAGPAPCPRLVWAWRELGRTGGLIPINTLAEHTGRGWRQLDYRFREQIGLAPKTAARVLRLRHALSLLGEGHGLARTAVNCGFSDQSHFCREIKVMTGRTPGRFVADRSASATFPMAADRVSDRTTSVVLAS
jgi:AraC-like DNA-binding protein